MRKFIFALILFNLLSLVLKAQNPESGWFLSLQRNECTLAKTGDSLSYEGMGWSEIPTGKYAFEFSESSIIVYSDGWMGKEYKSQKSYTVTKRRMIGVEDDFTVYEYYAVYSNEKVRFLIKVQNKDEYKAAYISLYEGLNPENYFEKKTMYLCMRDYK